ncbi:XapX domain protein [Acinetobacter sp. ATCC 27244]|nr:XapX domain protein [Acinetobacter sp. ATCC 27244]
MIGHTSEISVMKMYLLSLGVGLLVGVLYYVLNVRSPAPPIVALVGLLGMVVGEKLIPLIKDFFPS